MTGTLALILLLPPVLALSLFLIFLCVITEDEDWSEGCWQELEAALLPPLPRPPLYRLLGSPDDGPILHWRGPRSQEFSAN